MEAEKQRLVQTMSTFEPLTEEQAEKMVGYFTAHEYEAGEYITESGKNSDTLAFVCEGFMRGYVISLEGDEVTTHIASPGFFIGAMSSFLGRQKSDEFVQAITKCRFLSIKYDALQELYASERIFDRIGRQVIEQLFLYKQLRIISLIKHSAEDRYKFLLQNAPEILQNVPLKILASYLGIKPETLSRIRARIS